MKRHRSSIIVTCLSFVCLCLVPVIQAAQSPALVPQPVSLEWAEGAFEVIPSTRIVASGPAQAEADMLIDMLEPALGFRLKRVAGRVEQNAIGSKRGQVVMCKVTFRYSRLL